MSVAAVLLDVDGTMCDTDLFHRRVWADILLPHGFDVSESWYNEHISGKHNDNIAKELFPNMSAQAHADLIEDKERRFRELAGAELEPLDGFGEFVRRLNERNVPTAAVTNAPRANVEMMFKRFGLWSGEAAITVSGCRGAVGALDCVVIGGEGECRIPKPHPQAYQLAAKYLNVSSARCIVFEDSISGVRAGVAAGCTVVGVLSSQTRDVMISLGCADTIHDFTQIDVQDMMDGRPFVKQRAAN